MPVSGEITEINESLNDSPELINNDPYEGGWIIKIKKVNEEKEDLLSPQNYSQIIGSSSEIASISVAHSLTDKTVVS